MQIGVIMIIGLAAKNAILIVEFAKERVDKGIDPMEAVVIASKLRLRPILMTAFTAIIGCLPLAFASGAGAGARCGMGVAVVGGMTFATLCGLLLILAFYIISEKNGPQLLESHRPETNQIQTPHVEAVKKKLVACAASFFKWLVASG